MAQYDMNAGTGTYIDIPTVTDVLGEGAMGLAVDIDTHLLYITTGYQGDNLQVFDSSLSELAGSPYPDTEGMILNPAGIVIPSEEIGYEPEIEVPMDIKPTSCPNPLNKKDKGVLPVAILGTEDYDVTMVDPSSVQLAGVVPLR